MADKKITALTEDTAPTSDDLVETVHDPGGTPASRKATLANLTKGLSVVVGDSGSGGTKGLVPAPGVGDAAAGKFLKADGTFAVPTGTTPGAHAASHQNGGGDEIDVTGLSGVLADPQVPITENVQDIVGALFIDNSHLDLTYDDGAGSVVAVIKTDAPPLSPATVTLTDGATITWATAGARQNNARVTLGGDRTLDITGEVDGATGLLIVIQDGTGGRDLTLPGGSKVIGGGSGAVTLSTGAGDIDILTWYYDGTNFFWTIGTDYT